MDVIGSYVLPEGCNLGLKVVHGNGKPESWRAAIGFRWNLTLGGWTEAPDWKLAQKCGGGLHLWEWAQGDLRASKIWLRPDVIWLAVEYESSEAVDLNGKIKVPKCRTVAVSPDKMEIVSFIKHHTPAEKQGLFLFDGKTVEEGDVEVGDGNTAITKGNGTAVAGWLGTAIAGDGGSAFVGMGGVAVAGHKGFAYVGERGVASAGDKGVASVGPDGKAKAGVGGKLVFRYWDQTFYVGQNGIKPDTFYELNGSGHSPIEAEV